MHSNRQLSRSIWEEVLLFLVSFRSQMFDVFLDLVPLDLVLNTIYIDFYAVKNFIFINLL